MEEEKKGRRNVTYQIGKRQHSTLAFSLSLVTDRTGTPGDQSDNLFSIKSVN